MRIERKNGIAALQAAARALGIELRYLTPSDYRAFRASLPDPTSIPSDLAVALVFGTWQRACDRAADSAAASS